MISRQIGSNFLRVLPGNHGVRIVFGQTLLLEPKRVEFAVKRRTSDLQPPGNLRHLPAVMRYCEPNDLGFEFLERPDLSLSIE